MPEIVKQIPAPAAPEYRQGQNVKFELDENVEFVVLGGDNRIYLAKPEDLHEVESLKGKLATAKDGRYVGIYYRAGRVRYHVTEETEVNGKKVGTTADRFCHCPARVVAYRAVMRDNGDHHPTHAVDGRVIVVMFNATCLRNVAPVLLQEDLPGYRRQTAHKDWNPRA
jgi:hypothetical protein